MDIRIFLMVDTKVIVIHYEKNNVIMQVVCGDNRMALKEALKLYKDDKVRSFTVEKRI